MFVLVAHVGDFAVGTGELGIDGGIVVEAGKLVCWEVACVAQKSPRRDVAFASPACSWSPSP